MSNEYLTMSITSMGPSTIPKPDPKPFYEKKINDISDISGAQTKSKYHQFYNKPQFLQSDIPGSTSKILSHGRNVRDNSLYIDDIDGTRHTIRERILRTNRHVDPLIPEYKLPSYTASEVPVVKFVKDPLNIKDIEGTAPRIKKVFETRDNISVFDIEGAQTNWKPTHV
jgi:hypothetical protein